MSSHIVLMNFASKVVFMTNWGLNKLNIMFCELYKILSLNGLKSGSLYKFYKVKVILLGLRSNTYYYGYYIQVLVYYGFY